MPVVPVMDEEVARLEGDPGAGWVVLGCVEELPHVGGCGGRVVWLAPFGLGARVWCLQSFPRGLDDDGEVDTPPTECRCTKGGKRRS